LPGHREDVALQHDLDEARQLLAEAGYRDGNGLRKVKAIVYKRYAHIVKPLRYFWEEILGLNIEWQVLDWQAYNRQLEDGESDLFLEGIFAPTPNPDDFLSNFAIPRQYWPGEAFRDLVARARGVADPAARLHLYEQAEDILLQEIPLLPLYYWQYNLLVKPWVRSYRPTMLFLESWKDVVIEPH
jgi:oligopeptide transport system substrate-binding protein